MINFEALAIAWLNADTAITAPVAGRAPSDLTAPFVRVQLITAPLDPRSPANHLATGYLQLDCYGGADEDAAQTEAFATASACADRLHTLHGAHGDAIVAAVTGISMRRVPDTALSPARERYIVEAQVTARPAPTP